MLFPVGGVNLEFPLSDQNLLSFLFSVPRAQMKQAASPPLHIMAW